MSAALVGNVSNGAGSSGDVAEKSQIKAQVALSGSNGQSSSGQAAGAPAGGSGDQVGTVSGTGSDVAGADGRGVAAPGQTTAAVPLSPADPKATAGEVRADGLVYAVNPDGATVTLVGWHGAAPAGDVAVPSAVASGADSYTVTDVGRPAPEGGEPAPGVLAGAQASTLSLPESVENVAEGALAGCPSLKRVLVSAANERFASFDGMLFDKGLYRLLLVPEGKEGACRLPDQTTDVSVSALSRAAGIVSVEVGEGSAAFASRNGMLCSKDLKTLVACPSGAGRAVVLPFEVESVGAGAFAGCALESVAAPGFVRDIAPSAFADESKAEAVVALPAGRDYDARRAVWEAAGFSRFAEPAAPGDVAIPGAHEGGEGPDAAQASGLAYEVLDDYTLAVSWKGADEAPADLVVPAIAEVGGASYRVSAVAANGFAGLASLRSVELPASVASIGAGAFAGCAGLASARLPEGLRSLGDRAFEATALADAWLPESVEAVGSRALAACAALSRVVALGSPEVASDALAACAGVSVYCPAGSASSWNVGIPAAGNRLAPYGAELDAEPLKLEVGQSASLLREGGLQAPEPIEASYSYAAKPLSVDSDGTATGKAAGTSEVSVALALEGVELARASRTVEVREAPEAQEPAAEEPAVGEGASGETGQGDASLAEEHGIGLMSLDLEPRMISAVLMLETGQTFDAAAPATGQMLRCTVLSGTTATGAKRVSVGAADAAACAGRLEIPRTVVDGDGQEYTVASVASNGFQRCKQLLSVTIPDTVETIGSSAFNTCIELNEVEFTGSNLKTIEDFAFTGCRSLGVVDIPSGVTKLGLSAFGLCASLREAAVPDSVTTVGNSLFDSCSQLESVFIGKGLASLSARMFSYCTSLRWLVVEGEVATFQPDSFYLVDTSNLSVRVATQAQRDVWTAMNDEMGYGINPDNISVFGSLATVAFESEGGEFASFSRQVPKGQAISEPAVPVRDGLSVEGWYVKGEPAVRWDFTQQVTGDMTLVARWTEAAFDGAFVYKVRSDGKSASVAAANRTALSGRVELSEGCVIGGAWYPVREVASNGFADAQGITSVFVPASVQVINVQAFSRCANLESVELGAGSGLKTIEADAFSDCSALKGMSFPASLENLGRASFLGCSSMEGAEFENGSVLRTVQDAAFRGCSKLTSVSLPDSVEYVFQMAFHSCPLLSAVRLPSGLRTVDDATFANCASLEGIELPASLERIGSNAFGGSGLKSVGMPDSSLEIGSGAFQNCASLNTVALGLRTTFVNQKARSFENCPQLSTLFAAGKMESGNIAAAFPDSLKGESGATVMLPPIARDGSGNDFAAMAETWKSAHGFAKAACSGGDLLAADRVSVAGRWNLTSDFALEIVQVDPSKAIADLGWDKTADNFAQGHWGQFRDLVASVRMQDGLKAASVSGWFANMVRLVDANGAFVPEGATEARWMFEGCTALRAVPADLVRSTELLNVDNMFYRCEAIASLPENFSLPDSITSLKSLFDECHSLGSLPRMFKIPRQANDVSGMLAHCFALEELPEDFSLPQNVEYASSMFFESKALRSLPDKFVLPDSIKLARHMFYFCSSLEGLPRGFMRSSLAARDFTGMFLACTSLRSLPSDFAIPVSSDTTIANMFLNCSSLAVLPASLKLADIDEAKAANAFKHEGPSPLPTIYLGDAAETMSANYWTLQNRTLVTDPARLPGGVRLVSLKVSDEQPAGAWKDWATLETDASGLLVEPQVCGRVGQVFTLWYADPECTKRVDFSKPVADQAKADASGSFVLYGKFASGSQGGSLPCKADTGSAFWSLDADGTLYIRGGGVIDKIGWDNKTVGTVDLHWSMLHSQIKKVAMAPSCRAQIMEYWFTGCENLVDIEGVVIPEGAISTGDLFSNCSSLRNLPENFNLPATVGWTFSMFKDTPIASLPANFRLPANINNCANMFKNCRNLTSLPQGFAIPKTVSNMPEIFYGCDALTMLPDDFSFPAETVVNSDTGKNRRPFFVSVESGAPLVPLYYGGSDPAVLNFDWASQNRVLVTDPADRGMFEVAYKLVNADGTWSTRTTALTDSAGMVPNPGEPQHEGYGFTGWCADEDCLKPFDFSQPVSEATTLYGKWVKHGGRDKPVGEGQLPTVDGGEAWWQITIDDTLMILGDGTVSDFQWNWNVNVSDKLVTEHWGPHRDSVKRIVMGEKLGALDMSSWFQDMTKLTDIDGVRIPYGVTIVHCMLKGCTALNVVPRDFHLRIPETTTSIRSLFNGCTSLEELPDGFVVPSTVKDMSAMFAGSKLRVLPQSFIIPKSVVRADDLFFSCQNLTSLPAGFTIPDTVQHACQFFYQCTSLKALPEGFSVSKKLAASRDMNNMFYKCSSLTYLPASFDFPLDKALGAGSLFWCETMTDTYFAGGANSASNVVKYTKWKDQNRNIVYSVPSGQWEVTFVLPDVKTAEQKPWLKQLVAQDAKLAEPAVPARVGQAFSGWYADADCTVKFDFAQPITRNTSIYGKYAATSGSLPTENGRNDGSWRFDNGTLFISSTDRISNLRWDSVASGAKSSAYGPLWGPLRNDVAKLVIDRQTRMVNMERWFCNMPNLKDVEEFFIPEGTRSIAVAFSKSSGLSKLPSDLTIPSSVVTTESMFLNCDKLTSLPSGFVFPKDSAVTNVKTMFFGCRSLESLPPEFVLPRNVQNMKEMFQNCVNLKSLPGDFTLPAELRDATDAFNGCASLVSLPAGFSVPASAQKIPRLFAGCTSLASLPDRFCFAAPSSLGDVTDAFSNCPSLVSLPATLDMSVLAGVTGVETMFAGLSGSTADNPLATYFSGSNASSLSPDGTSAADYWKSNYKRALVVGSDSLPGGLRKATFKTKVLGAAEWDTWQTVLSDASGKVVDPQIAGKFGYAFDGWYADADCQIKFDFGTETLKADAVLYGVYKLVVRYEVPVKAQVAIDASGAVAPAEVEMRSFTPVPLAVSRVSCEVANAATEVMAPEGMQGVVAEILPAGESRSFPVKPGGSTGTPDTFATPAAEPGSPGVLRYSVGLYLPDPAKVRFWGDGWSTDFLRLSYTLSPSA